MNKVFIGLVLGMSLCSVVVVEAGKRGREEYEADDQTYMGGPQQQRNVRFCVDENQTQDIMDDAALPVQPAAPQPQQAEMNRWQWLLWLSQFMSNRQQQEVAAAQIAADYEAAMSNGEWFNICTIL